MNIRLPAEWEEQDGVLLSWPHKNTDWADALDQVEPVFDRIAETISRFERVVIATPEPESVRARLENTGALMERIALYKTPTNDTWSRDFGPITVLEDGKPRLLDFGFNGWGLKFASNFDNQVTTALADAGCFGSTEIHIPGLILEGGSIESDGQGTLLTTTECLINPNRNPHLEKEQIEARLSDLFGTDHYLWLDNGYLAGDDTDSHIDTLARLCPDDTIAYVKCDDQSDEHYSALTLMEAELKALRTRDGGLYRLIALPWPEACFDDDGERLPATYANFLVINGAVLVPTYEDERDKEALAAIREAFPDRQVIGIDCRALILQHGSLHCVTMQIPKGVLA